MNTDEDLHGDLKRRFDDAIPDVRPSADLYQRTEARLRRRGPSRLLAGAAAVGLAVTAGVVAINLLDPSPVGPHIDPIASQPSEEPADPPSEDATEVATGQPSPQGATAPAGQPTDGPTADAPGSDDTDTSEPPTIRGEPYIGPPIVAGAAMSVLGVEADDVLNVRAAPGTEHDVIATLEPLADDAVATGEGRMLDDAVWVEVDTGDVTGWVHAGFVAHASTTEDITSEVIEQHGSRPRAGTLVELAEIVAEQRATEEPPSRLVISDGPRVGDLGEVTIDVVGMGDDAVRGLRLVVFATPDDGAFTLRSVEATTYCGRGVTDDDLCL